MRTARTRALVVVAAALSTALTACVDTVAAPLTPGKRALKDTTGFVGDSTLCRSGYHIINGRIVCNAEQ